MAIAVGILLLLIVCNAVFAMSEIAVVASRTTRLAAAAERGDRGAASALALTKEPTRFLSTIQVGITLIGILAGALGDRAIASGLAEALGRIPALAPMADVAALVIVVLLITYVSLILGELVPKRIGMTRPESIAMLLAPPMTLLSRLTAPAVKVLSVSTEAMLRLLRVKPAANDDVSEEDVRAMLSRGAQTGVFQPFERAIVDRVFRLADLPAEALMVPRSEIVWLNESDSVERIRVAVAADPFSHFPVCRGGLHDIVGVVHVKDLVRNGLIVGGDIRLADLAQDPIFVPESTPALQVLETFRSSRNHVAFVVDEYGSVEGLVTLNDILQAIVGDLSREGEPEGPSAVRRADGTWLVDGRLHIRDMLDRLGVPCDEEDLPDDVHTAGGLVMSLLGHVPAEGESARWRGLRFEVMDMDGQRVDKILAAIEGAPPGEHEPQP